MQPLVPWFDMRWDFSFPAAWFPLLLERLRGTPARCHSAIGGLSDATLTARIGETWSIIENIGHLTDVESLWTERFDQFEQGADTLVAADVTNRTTWDADHRARPTADVMNEFERTRAATVGRLEAWNTEAHWERSAMHPRLETPMRAIDLAVFVADHDDYHLARMHQMRTELNTG